MRHTTIGAGHLVGFPTLLLAVACNSEGTRVSSQTAALNGTFNVDDSCTPLEKGRIESARQYIADQFLLNSGGLDECMLDAFFADDKALSVERILGLMKEYQSTSIGCADSDASDCSGVHGWWGCASAFSGPGSEALRLSHQMLCGSRDGQICESPTRASLVAGTILHEVAHNKTFGHDGVTSYELRLSVNEQLDACIASGNPNGARRSRMAFEAELAAAGFKGGDPGGTFCASGWVRGLRIAADSVVRSITPLCGDVRDGSALPGPMVGGGATDSLCLVGQFATGVFGRSGDTIDQLGVACSSTDEILKKNPRNTPQPAVGGSGGDMFQRSCPPGMALWGFYTRNSAALDQLRPVCREISVTGPSPATPTPMAGSTAGFHSVERCTGMGAVFGLYGRSGKFVDRVGGICQDLGDLETGVSALKAFKEHATTAGIEPTAGGEPFQDRCPEHMALVGVSARAGANLDNIQGQCASIAQWKGGAVTTLSPLAARGGPGGVEQALMCPPTQFVVGFETWEEVGPTSSLGTYTTMRGIRPVCRKLPFDELTTSLVIDVVGAGRIVGPGPLTCEQDCSRQLRLGDSPTLQAIAADGWTLDHWEGGCVGQAATCALGPMLRDQGVRAVFVPIPHPEPPAPLPLADAGWMVVDGAVPEVNKGDGGLAPPDMRAAGVVPDAGGNLGGDGAPMTSDGSGAGAPGASGGCNVGKSSGAVSMSLPALFLCLVVGSRWIVRSSRRRSCASASRVGRTCRASKSL